MVCYTAKEVVKRSKEIRKRLEAVAKKTGYDLKVIVIDATPGKKSAAKL